MIIRSSETVSYTHLDVYKRQILGHEDVLHKCASLLLEKEKVHRDEFEALFTTEDPETENNSI